MCNIFTYKPALLGGSTAEAKSDSMDNGTHLSGPFDDVVNISSIFYCLTGPSKKWSTFQGVLHFDVVHLLSGNII